MILLTLFLALLVAVMFVAYKGAESSAGFAFDPVSALTVRVGRTMFEWVLAAELAILLFIVPGISAGSIAGERDRQTLVPLQVTLVGPVGIFFGKVLASSGFVLLLIVGAAPVMAVPYLVGGISLSQVLLSLLTLLIIGFLVAVIGVSCSAVFRRTQTATLAAYGAVLALTLGTVLLLGVLAVIDASRGDDETEPRLATMYPNPFLAVADAAGEIGTSSDGPFTPIKRLFLESQVGSNVIIVDEGNFGPGGGGVVAFDEQTGQPVQVDLTTSGVPLWARSLLTLTGLALLSALFGVRRLRAPGKEIRS